MLVVLGVVVVVAVVVFVVVRWLKLRSDAETGECIAGGGWWIGTFG